MKFPPWPRLATAASAVLLVLAGVLVPAGAATAGTTLGTAAADGANVVQDTGWGGDNQPWQLVRVG